MKNAKKWRYFCKKTYSTTIKNLANTVIKFMKKKMENKRYWK